MSRTLLIRAAATLALVTCVSLIVGTFMAVPPEQVAMDATIATMKATLVTMPVGAARSYMQILDGNNLCTSLFLLVCAALLFSIASLPSAPATNRVTLVAALGLAGFAIASAMYFFPIPTAFTGIASLLGIIARSRSHG